MTKNTSTKKAAEKAADKSTSDIKPPEEKKDKKVETDRVSEAQEGKQSYKSLLIAVIILFVVVSGVGAYMLFGQKGTAPNSNNGKNVVVDLNGDVIEDDEPAIIPRRVDGVMVAREDANRVLACVMIENAAFGGVRPQSGLSRASVVYEVIVEGGITRLMAIFAGEESEVVGPVRSARDTYLEFASEYNCMYTHAGGSYTAMQAIPRFGMRDLDGLREPQYFYRDSGKVAPHNLFTSTESLYKAIDDHSWSKEEEPNYDSWYFVDAVGAPTTIDESVVENESTDPEDIDESIVEEVQEVTTAEEPVTQVSILYGGSYNVEYNYKAEDNHYERVNGGVLQVDEVNGEVLTTKNIVVMHVGPGIEIEGKGRINWPVTGTGTVDIYHDGRLYSGTWSKENRESRLTFTDENGEPLPLLRGNVWVEVVPPHITVTTQ